MCYVWLTRVTRGCQKLNTGDNMFGELQTLINSAAGTSYILINGVFVCEIIRVMMM